MSISVIALILLFFIFLAGKVWVFVSLMGIGIIAAYIETSVPISRLVSVQLFNAVSTPELLALPLFIFMAEILFRTKMSQSLFSGLAPWTYRLPGRLLHVNVLACTLFASVCGSSAATTATVGKITLSELEKRGYPKELSMGSLAGAGTLGFLIPPSLIMIVYGVLSDTSIIDLFIAGLVPGVLLAICYMMMIGWRARKYPIPEGDKAPSGAWRVQSLAKILPLIFLVGLIIGSMYGGYASPTEAAVVGVFGAMLIALAQGGLTLSNMIAAALATARSASMIGLLIAAGTLLSIVMGYMGIPQSVASTIAAMDLSPTMLIILLLLGLIILGAFLDGTSILIMTLPITIPMIVQAGFDKVWFGVFLVLAIEMAQITPPVGFNLFIIQGLTSQPVNKIALNALPFFWVTIFFTLLIIFFPNIVLFIV